MKQTNEQPKEPELLTPLKGDELAAALKELAATLAALKAPTPEQVQRANQLARAKQQMREQNAELARQKAEHQAACKHRRQDGSSTIVFNFFSDNRERAICQRCQRMWDESDPEFAALKQLPSYNPSAMVRP